MATAESIRENPNIIWVGQAGFEAYADRVIVLQDEYRSGFECPTCLDENKHTIDGREVSSIPCESCGGEGRRPKVGNAEIKVRCEGCDGRGWVICPECNGKGGTIVLADDQKGRPTTGTIVSVGWMVDPDNWFVKLRAWFTGRKHFHRGDRCIYPSFSGHAYDLTAQDSKGRDRKIVLVVLRDQEIISSMFGSLEQNQVKRSAALHTAA